jgi:hypothetical protein
MRKCAVFEIRAAVADEESPALAAFVISTPGLKEHGFQVRDSCSCAVLQTVLE